MHRNAQKGATQGVSIVPSAKKNGIAALLRCFFVGGPVESLLS